MCMCVYWLKVPVNVYVCILIEGLINVYVCILVEGLINVYVCILVEGLINVYVCLLFEGLKEFRMETENFHPWISS